MDLRKQKTAAYAKIYEHIVQLRQDYSNIFINFFDLSLNNQLVSKNTQDKIREFYFQLENLWEDYIRATINVGFQNPLEWIANGNYEPEESISSQKVIRTRSGSIRRIH